MAKINDFALESIRWNDNGLIPAIAQETISKQVLMVAWMNRTALTETVESGEVVYWSRSRNSLWRKGESSGHRQKVLSIKLDCDNDVLLLEVEQIGGIACHTGRHHCFFQTLDMSSGDWAVSDPVLKSPDEIYNRGM